MSKYTMTLQNWFESETGLFQKPYSEVISAGLPLLFNFNFPIFSESYRTELETKIVKRYYMNEIGFETFELFRLNLDETLNRIMPYYNKMYETSLKEFDFLTTENVTESLTASNESSGNTVASEGSTVTAENIDKHSDTPQGAITNLQDGKYLSSADISNSNSQATGENTSNTTSATTTTQSQTYKGYRGYSPAELLKNAYSAIKNIDDMLIDELRTLFMIIW